MKKLLIAVLTLSTLNAFADSGKMTVAQAIEKLNGVYTPVEGQKNCEEIEIDLKLESDGLDIRRLDNSVKYYASRLAHDEDTKVTYGTRNKGTAAFINLKKVDYAGRHDAYSGSLLSRSKQVSDYRINADSNELTVTTTSKGWSLLYSSCTESGFFDKDKYVNVCKYTKN